MPRKLSGDDLLTPDHAVEALCGHVTAQAIRKHVRMGALQCYWQQRTPGKIFVKRSELIKLYHERIYGWEDVRRSL